MQAIVLQAERGFAMGSAAANEWLVAAYMVEAEVVFGVQSLGCAIPLGPPAPCSTS